MPINKERTTFERVQNVLVDALGVDEEEVTGNATIMGDLGAESIDFLDIAFRLEKEFRIKIPRGDLFPETVLRDRRFISGGKITEPGLAALKARLPWLDHQRLAQDPYVQRFLTVDDMRAYVDRMIAAS